MYIQISHKSKNFHACTITTGIVARPVEAIQVGELQHDTENPSVDNFGLIVTAVCLM